ncbi:nucleotidyltransferase domain-containing protein [Oceanobacillus halophilus]|uniref:Renal dipeptidase n=1 Tax=Oceanobacillus halophilus TaxID=930130 RepID=A0A495A1W6_9BACI|nr:nucleotidyltransferase family protein [Oceanobacillus halophilus]RKQ33475.1 Renal dipeptidase [Oceanobacillus halophilus]
MKNAFFLKTINLPEELKLILYLLKGDKPRKIDSALLKDIDWKQFMELSLHHRVYPILHSKIKQLDAIPPHVRNFLSNQYKSNTLQMLQLSGVMEGLSREFALNHIQVIFLKGPALAHDLYGDISMRTSSDLDLLIPIEQLGKADNLLINQGYEKDDYIHTVLNDWKWRHHHVTYFHPVTKVKLEIHWRLNPGPAYEPFFKSLWDRKRTSKLTTFPVYLLSKEDLFFFLISHGARHGWSRLRWLVDIGQLLEQDFHWGKTQKVIKKCHYQRAAGQGLLLASQLLEAKLSNRMRVIANKTSSKQLAQQAIFYLERQVNLHTDPVPEEIARYHKSHLFSLMSIQQRAFFILSFLYPYPEDYQTLPLPKPFHFLYFPLRPFLWVWRKKRKHALP